MLNILQGALVSKIDKLFVEEAGISSWDLMERACQSFVNWFKENYHPESRRVLCFCGPGNNGGDALGIARKLADSGYDVVCVVFEDLEKCSFDYQLNFRKLPDFVKVWDFNELTWEVQNSDILIDGVFGVGISRPLEGKYLLAVEWMNRQVCTKIAIDIPSGLPSDSLLLGLAYKADVTVSFQFPKFSLLLPEHAAYSGKLVLADIGIPDDLLSGFSQGKYFVRSHDIPGLHKKFNAFSHKGNYGRVLIIGGSKGKVGAVVLCSRGALRTGSGLVHAFVEEGERSIIQNSAAEVMCADQEEVKHLDKFDAVAIGPGWGTHHLPLTFEGFLKSYAKPMVIDADALNMLALYPELLRHLPKGSILTPHLGEFDRLAGKSANHIERLQKALSLAKEHGVYVVLKGAFTSVNCPDGTQYFNSTGSAYMATAGAGDVLTGIICSYLGQGYPPLHAAICGVFHHGMAGELASKDKRRGTIAGDIVEAIPATYVQLDIK